jgi:hypothetical protein
MPEPESSPWSRSRAAGVCSLLSACLLLPVLVAWGAKPGREGMYRTLPVNMGPYVAIERQIYQEQGDIDVLFLGDSFLWQAVDIPRVRDALTGDLGRPARVFSFSTNWAGLDRQYVLLRDLLARRRVGMVVLDLPAPDIPMEDKPHNLSYYWLRMGDDPELFRGLSSKDRATVYSVMVLGAPRFLLARLRSSPIDPKQADPALLSLVENRLGYLGAPFQEEPVRESPGTVIRFSPKSQGDFRFTGPALGPLQRHFAVLIAGLLGRYGVRGVILHVPRYSERHGTMVDERECWPKALDGRLELMGIPPARLFQGLSEDQIQHHFYNEHFNANGKRLFTQFLLPALRTLHAETPPESLPLAGNPADVGLP